MDVKEKSAPIGCAVVVISTSCKGLLRWNCRFFESLNPCWLARVMAWAHLKTCDIKSEDRIGKLKVICKLHQAERPELRTACNTKGDFPWTWFFCGTHGWTSKNPQSWDSHVLSCAKLWSLHCSPKMKSQPQKQYLFLLWEVHSLKKFWYNNKPNEISWHKHYQIFFSLSQAHPCNWFMVTASFLVYFLFQ